VQGDGVGAVFRLVGEMNVECKGLTDYAFSDVLTEARGN
jgi:hypothetical protein